MKKERAKESQSQRREGFFCNQREAESAMHRGIFYFLVFLVFAGLIQYGKEKYPEWKEAHSGIPDADKFRPYLDGEEIDFY